MARKPPRAARRAERYRCRKSTATTGRQQLVVAWEWLLAELTALAKANPGKAEGACRNLAGQVEAIAADMAKEVAREAHVPVR